LIVFARRIRDPCTTAARKGAISALFAGKSGDLIDSATNVCRRNNSAPASKVDKPLCGLIPTCAGSGSGRGMKTFLHVSPIALLRAAPAAGPWVLCPFCADQRFRNLTPARAAAGNSLDAHGQRLAAGTLQAFRAAASGHRAGPHWSRQRRGQRFPARAFVLSLCFPGGRPYGTEVLGQRFKRLFPDDAGRRRHAHPAGISWRWSTPGFLAGQSASACAAGGLPAFLDPVFRNICGLVSCWPRL